jgi:hypothetical protein
MVCGTRARLTSYLHDTAGWKTSTASIRIEYLSVDRSVNGERTVKVRLGIAALFVTITIAFASSPHQASATQTQAPLAQTAPQVQPSPQVKGRSPGGDIGSGAGDIGKGTAAGAGNVAKGTGKGAVDLLTLHPLNAAGNVGKGAAVGGKDIGVGAAKGTGKVAKGVGRGIKHIF